MAAFRIDKNAPVLVELSTGPGLQAVSLSPAGILEKSTKALDSAMNTIYHMAERINATIGELAKQPSEVEVEFGLKLDAETGAVITKAGLEASLNVKLTWEGQDKSSEQRGSTSKSP